MFLTAWIHRSQLPSSNSSLPILVLLMQLPSEYPSPAMEALSTCPPGLALCQDGDVALERNGELLVLGKAPWAELAAVVWMPSITP